MRNLNLEFLIFSFVSGLTGGTLIWLIIGTLRMVLRHFLLLYPPPLRMPPLWHCHCHGHRPELSRRGLMIYLDWHSYFFDFSITYHLNWEKDPEWSILLSMLLRGLRTWGGKLKDDFSWKTFIKSWYWWCYTETWRGRFSSNLTECQVFLLFLIRSDVGLLVIWSGSTWFLAGENGHWAVAWTGWGSGGVLSTDESS